MTSSPTSTADLNQLLEGLMSTQNEIRSAAEIVLERDWREIDKVGTLLLFLATNAVEGANDNIRVFCAVLFRRMSIRSPKDSGSVIDRTIGEIDENTRSQVRAVLLQGFISYQSVTVRKRLADAIAEVARTDSTPQGSWDNLLPTLFDSARSQNSDLRDCAFRILSSCPEIIDHRCTDEVLLLFEAGFDDQVDDVRISACTAFVSFFRESPRKVWPLMSPLLPSLLNSLPRFLNSGHDEALSNVLENLVELAEMAPKMFRDMFPTIIEFCSSVCKNNELDTKARLAALELLTTFAENSPAMCKLTSSYSSTMVMVNLALLTEVSIDDDEAADWNNNDNTEDDDDEPEYEAARESLDRISLKLGGQAIAGPLFQYIPSMCQSANWRECFAALMALSAAAEGCSDILMPEIPKILDLVLPCIDHPHSRVQFACCNALGQMSTDFAGVIQETSGNRILPALISRLTTKSVFKVQKHASAALVNFCEVASNETLEPYLDELLTNLLTLLQSPKRYVQEQVLTTIAIIADAAQKKFEKYHSTLLPLLIDFLKSDMGDEHRLLKAKCVECVTLIATAVGKEIFALYSQSIIEIFMVLQKECVDVEDPLKPYLDQGWGRICKLIGKDFLSYLPFVLPPLLKTAKAAQDVSLLEENEAEEYKNSEEWDVINLSGKLIAVHTAALDDKVTAMDLLRTYAVQLRGDFFPWVDEIATDIAIPALDFYLHDGVRASASLTLAALFNCAIHATGALSHEASQMWNQVCAKISEVLISEPVPEVLMAYFTALVEILSLLDLRLITSDQLSLLAESLLSNLTEIYERLKGRDSGDDQFTEDIDEDNEEFTDEELLIEINRVISSIFKISGSSFALSYQKLLSQFVSTFIVDESNVIRLCALEVICDLIQYLPSSSEQLDYLRYVVNEFLSSLQAELRQGAAHAIKLAAECKSQQYVPLCVESIPMLFQVATFPDAKAEENVNATDNCVAAIAQICHFHHESIQNANAVISQWISLLPILHDEDAASSGYEFLSSLMETHHATVVAQSHKVVESVLLALSHKSINGAVAKRCIEATKSLLQGIPREEVLPMFQNFGDRGVIETYFKS